MPIIKSAIKRARQTITRRSRNLQVKRAIKQDITALYTAISTGEAENITSSLSMAYSQIDRAVKKAPFTKTPLLARRACSLKQLLRFQPKKPLQLKPPKLLPSLQPKKLLPKSPLPKKLPPRKLLPRL
ncbi:30S ribosomal protein S20 [bacterium]|nr:MAG: 30S ribosomal protein S20 [bacterium]